MATAALVDKTLRDLIRRFSAAPDGLASALPERRSIVCVVPDAGATYRAEYAEQKLGKLERIPEPEAADVVITISGDDLLALADGRLSVPAALLTRRLRVQASVQDLMLLRALFR